MNTKIIVIIGAILSCALMVAFWASRSLQQHELESTGQLRNILDNQARISLLTHQLGYSGFIHNFKNYILRGDEYYYRATLKDLESLEMMFQNGKMAFKQEAVAEQIKTIETTLQEYQVKLELARQLHNQDLPPAEIDQRVKVNDLAAAEALRNLITSFQAQAATLLRESTQQQGYHHQHLILTAFLSVGISAVACAFCWGIVAGLRRRLREQSDITSRQKLLDAAPNPTLVVAESGEILIANEGAAKLFECESGFLVGKQVENFLPEAQRVDHADFRKLFFSSAGERTMRNPVFMVTAKHSMKKVEILIGLYQVEQVRYAVVNMMDISSLESIERHAAEMEQHFKITFELAPVGMAQISLEGRFIKANRQLSAILGYERLALEEMALDDLTPATERNSNRLTLKRLLSNEVDHMRFEKRLLDSNARDVWVTLTMTVYRDYKGRPEYLIAIVEDISYRKQYEEELLASEAKFKSIANHVNAVVWMSSPGMDKVMFVSNRYETMWGRSIASLLHNPRSFMDAILQEDRAKVDAEVENHRKGIWNVNYRILNKEGEVRYIHDEGVPVRSVKGELLFMVGLARDVTDERVARQKLERSNRQLEQLAKFDPLTMAVRRPYAISDLDECIALFNRYKTPASLIFIDLNDFKEVNDTYGHEAGDQVLIEFSRCMRKNIRQTDGFYRYAGDEFLLLLRETDATEAAGFLQKLDSLLASTRIEEYEKVQITASYGSLSLGEETVTDANHWIKLADARMYQYKKQFKQSSVHH
ncbi:MAG: hypothetical protein CMK89_10590 [Pseudomonadales bacterium]|nr:hypothetical protein [Pseudomonadales bacterium]